MTAVADAARRAGGEPRGAAAWFVRQLSDESMDILLMFIEPPGFAHWPLDMILDFETRESPVLIRGRWGDIWFCPLDEPYTALHPRVTPRALRSLGLALIDYLTSSPSEPDDEVPDGLYPEGNSHAA